MDIDMVNDISRSMLGLVKWVCGSTSMCKCIFPRGTTVPFGVLVRLQTKSTWHSGVSTRQRT